MNDADRESLETRVLLLAPTVKDGELTCAILARAGIACLPCSDQVQVCEQLTAGASAVLIAEEAVHGGDGCLAEWLGRQPPWSDLPVLVLARVGANSDAVVRAMGELGNVTVLERPARVAALVSVVRTALRARRRQYQLRDQLVQRERVVEQLQMALSIGNAITFTWDIPKNEVQRLQPLNSVLGATSASPDTFEEVCAKVHPNDRDAFEQQVRQAIERPGREYTNECRMVGPDGSVRWISDTGRVEFSTDGKPLRLVGLSTDITERREAEEARHELERNYRALTAASSEVVYRMSADWSTLLPLDGRQLVSSSDQPLADWAWLDLNLPPDEHSRVRQAISAAIARKTLFELEHRVWRADGSIGWTFSRAVPILDENEAVIAWFGAASDITERKQAEDKLWESESRFAVALKNSRILVYTADADLRYTWIHNPHPAFDPAGVIGRRDDELLSPEQAAPLIAIKQEVLNGGGGRRAEFAVEINGERHVYDLTVEPLQDGTGGVVGVSAAATDITDRKRAEEVLRESEARLGGILRQSPAGIVQTDAAGCMTLVNPRWCDMLGHPEAELLGRSIIEITHPSSVAATAAAFSRLAAGGPDFQIEKAYTRKDGSVLRAQSNVAAIRSLDGEFLGLIAVVLDISERLRSEEELRRLAAELSEADRRKDVFLATLAHELRNPLAPIRNGLQVMKLTSNNGVAVEQVRAMIERQLLQVIRLVDDLLDVSRITQGKIELRMERVDLRAVIEAAVETSRPAVEQAGHELVVVVKDEPIFVDGDATRLAQVVSNLLHNSAKYTHRGGHVRLMVGREDGTAVVSVKDNGIGIPPAMIGRVFEMFTQVDRTLEKTTGGLGIGLSLVKGLLDMHGGTIEAQSDGEGMGSEFVVRLPVVMGVVAGPDRPNGQTGEVVPSAARRILVVDDNVDAADSLGQLLEMMGNEVRTANDGEAGFGLAAQFRPDLVLMDIGMPKLNGYEAARRIRQHPWGRAMVLVALTGWGQDDDRKKSADAGFDHHLVKPVELDAVTKLMSG